MIGKLLYACFGVCSQLATRIGRCPIRAFSFRNPSLNVFSRQPMCIQINTYYGGCGHTNPNLVRCRRKSTCTVRNTRYENNSARYECSWCSFVHNRMWFHYRWSTNSRKFDVHLAESYWLFDSVWDDRWRSLNNTYGGYMLT